MLPSNPICPVCNYATSAVYCDLPSPEQLVNGVKPLDSLPAAWWNKMWNMINCSVNQARGAVGSFITELNNVLAGAGICPNCVCTDQLYQAIDRIRQTIGNATVAGAVKSSSTPGMVSIDNNGFMTANCVGNATQLATSARTLVGAVNELKTTYDTCFGSVSTALEGKAPTSHASSATTYGVGTSTNYGHLRISDTYTSNLGDAGMAASQTALYNVYNYATQISAAAIGLGNIAGCPLGTASAGTAATAARSDHVHPSCSSTTFVLDVSNPDRWDAGLRINTTCSGWTSLVMGGSVGSCCGCTGAFSLHTNCICCPKKLFVAYQGSDSLSYFEPTGGAKGTVRWHGNVCGDVYGNVCGIVCGDVRGNVCGLAACAIRARCVCYVACNAAGLYHVALSSINYSDNSYVYVSCACPLTYCNTTGTLTANRFCGLADRAACNGSGIAFGTAATCDATSLFREIGDDIDSDNFTPAMNTSGSHRDSSHYPDWTGSLYTFLTPNVSQSGLMFRILGGGAGPNQVQMNYIIDRNQFGMDWATIINSQNIASQSVACAACATCATCATCAAYATCATCAVNATCAACAAYATCATCAVNATWATCAACATCATCAACATCATCAACAAYATCATCAVNATWATCTHAVVDYCGSSPIQIAYNGPSLARGQIRYLAAFSTNLESGKTIIKDASLDAVQSWLGLGSAAYCDASAFRPSSWTPSCVACADRALCAGQVTSFGNVIATRNPLMRTWSIYALCTGTAPSVSECDIVKAICCATGNPLQGFHMTVSGFMGACTIICEIQATVPGRIAVWLRRDDSTVGWYNLCATCNKSWCLPISFGGSY